MFSQIENLVRNFCGATATKPHLPNTCDSFVEFDSTMEASQARAMCWSP